MHDILAGVAHIGRRGVVHRDIKASNVLIDEYGKAKLSDFGLVKKEVENTHTHTYIHTQNNFFVLLVQHSKLCRSKPSLCFSVYRLEVVMALSQA